MSTEALIRQRDQYYRDAQAHDKNANRYQTQANVAAAQLTLAQNQLALAVGARSACTSLRGQLIDYHDSVRDYALRVRIALAADSFDLSKNESYEGEELDSAIRAADDLVAHWEDECSSLSAKKASYEEHARSERVAAMRSQQAANQCQRSIIIRQ